MPHERTLIGVVEDDPVAGGTLAHRLELEGYKPVWWREGHQAIDGLRTARPELVVCDIRLPDMDGEDVFLKVLPFLGGTPFLFVTAYGQIEQAVRLTKAGAVDYIAKPYALPDLLERIPRLIAQRQGAAGALGTSSAMRQLELLLDAWLTLTAHCFSRARVALARKSLHASFTRFRPAHRRRSWL